ncbi:MAG: radical SAM protein, partial [Anaerolineae bacterium]
ALNQAYQLFCARLDHVELLIGYEGNAFASTGNLADDLLSITAVHPMREDAVQALLARSGAGKTLVQDLVAGGQLVETTYDGRRFYSRKLKGVSM